MTKSRLALISILATLLAVVGYQRYSEHLDQLRLRKDSAAAAIAISEAWARMKRNAEEHEQNFSDLAAIQLMPQGYPRPPSEWFSNEKQLYGKLVAKSQYDVIVAPFQIDQWGFDRATRSVMTAELAVAVEKSHIGTVLDPYLISKALGDGQREFERAELYRIAESVGAKRIIFGSVGHNSKGKMSIKLLSQPTQPRTRSNRGTRITMKAVDNIGFDDEHTPIEVFEQQLPGLLRAIGIDVAVAQEAPAAQLGLEQLTDSPLDLVRNNTNAAQSVYTYLLFGLLTPDHVERTRERFAAKAFAATSSLAPTSPEYRALRARAYMMLGYRMAALRALGTPSTVEEHELFAALNGNLPDVRAWGAKERNPLKRLIAGLDSNRIAADFSSITSKQSVADFKSLSLPGKIWPYLAARAGTDWDSWSQWDNTSLKVVLDHEFPRPGYTLEDIVRGAAAIGGGDRIRTAVDLSVFNHAQQYLLDNLVPARYPIARFEPTELDYLELLSAIGHDNLIRHLDFLSAVQGQPQQALEEARLIESLYKGYPYYTLARARAEELAAQHTGGAEQDGLLKAGYEDAFNAMYWEQSQSRVSSDALNLLAQIGRDEYGYFDNFYYTDIPYHPQYMLWGMGGNPPTVQANGLAALRNATSQFSAVTALVGSDRERLANQKLCDDVVELIDGRFIGSPERGTLLADLQLLHGNTGAADALLRADIKAAPNFKQAYLDLGTIAFESGRPSEAARVFRSYPGLEHSSVDNSVATSNVAYDMARNFYDSGDFQLASPLLQIAATQGSGSDAEMSARMRLQVLSGNMRQTLAIALERGQRYNDANAFRDYLAILHATGHSESAWSGFNTLIRQLNESAIWDSALVGHHKERSSEAAVTAWTRQDGFAQAGNHVSFAANYLTKFATTDRVPSRELVDTIGEIDRAAWQMEDSLHSVVRPDGNGRDQQILGPAGAINSHGVLPIGEFDRGKKHRVKSGLAYFVEAYREIKLGNFESARRLFDEAAGLYDMQSPHSSYVLPYYALAVARSGTNPATIESILSRFSPKEQGFDYQLARAVLTSVRGNMDVVLKSLKLARYRRWRDDERPLMTQYTYGDICEALYQSTGNADIRREALDWARVRERAEPWQAWSYALEAVLAPDSADRKRAIAMAYYLDPQSARLSTLKPAQIEDAVKAFSQLNIFLFEKGKKSNPAAI